MAERRRPPPQPPAGPQIQFKPGMADELMRELAPLLAEDGIDINTLDASDMDTFQRALDRAVERHNMTLFTPVGQGRDLAVAVLKQVVHAIITGDTTAAAALLDQVQPESPDNSTATVAACIGLALGLLDDWLGDQEPTTPSNLTPRTRLPAGHWPGQAAATDILVVANKGRAFRSLHSLMVGHGGKNVLHGSVLALAAVIDTWSHQTGNPTQDLIHTRIH